MRPILPLVVAVSLALLAIPSAASATIFGVQSDGELVNSDRTREQQGAVLAAMRAQGATVVRINVGWNEVAAACGGRSVATLRNPDNGCYSWSVVDGVVQQAAANRIQVLMTVSRAPQWLHRTDDSSYVGASSAQWTRTVQHYATFMAAAATRYRAGSAHGYVRLWTVWNEPNSATFFGPINTPILRSAAPKRYAQMVGTTAVAIRRASPTALVAIGPTGPNSTIKPVTFIKTFQASLPRFLPGTGAAERSYIAAWAHNPYPGIAVPPSRGKIKSPAIGMTNIRDLFTQLDAAKITRGLPVWATEFAYQTNPPDKALGISPALQGRFLGESFDWLDSTGRVTVAIWYGFRDGSHVADWQGGTHFADGTPKVSRAWWQRAISVPIGATRRGAYVRVWARSMTNPRATRIATSTNGRTWRLLPAVGRRRDGTTRLRSRVTRTTWFATWDGVRGPARIVFVR